MKKYTREEKKKYYQSKILNLEFALKKAQERLEYIMSEEYQDWDSDLQKELDQKNKNLRKSAV